MVIKIDPPINADGSYNLAGDGVFGPAEPMHAADLGVETSSVDTAQSLRDGQILSCDCTNSLAIWLNDDGMIIETEDLFDAAMVDSDDDQVFRLVSYPNNYEGVRALK